jgi:hypothetical protein
MSTESNKSTTEKENSSIKINKKRPDPFVPLWLAILFFAIDYLAFQKPLSGFVSWLLTVIPLLLLSLSFFLFALRKQFPWFGFPLDPLVTSTIIPERNNVFRATIFCIVFAYIAVIITISFLFPK